MTLGYPKEMAGQINVTATKEEWRDVLDTLDLSPRRLSGAAESLVYWLINQGVYDE